MANPQGNANAPSVSHQVRRDQHLINKSHRVVRPDGHDENVVYASDFRIKRTVDTTSCEYRTNFPYHLLRSYTYFTFIISEDIFIIFCCSLPVTYNLKENVF